MNDRRDGGESRESTKSQALRRLVSLLLCALWLGLGLGLSSCGSQPPPDDDVTYQQCEWGVGCTPQCTIKYGRSSYCDRD
ncbi:MAG TPA: hypothetical protein VMG55_05745 [Stellaceae bacterium]|nr:hypothetical protein [Stellaceae bacterium]